MLDDKTTLCLNDAELSQIVAAIATQEKILSLQTRAGDNAAKRQLNALKSLSQSIRRQEARAHGPNARVRLGWFGSRCHSSA